jgi:short-subunit dehydrogenase
VRKIAHAAFEQFGGFDTWVNDAGSSVYGRLLEVKTEDFRRLFDTNFWGVVYGSLEAARHLRQRGGRYGGAILNVGSEVSDRALPVQGMYSASKHAVKGFTDALRMELEKERAPVSVTLVKPGATDTPFPEHAKNYLEEEPTLPPPVYAPEVVAEVILHCAETPERDIFAAGSAKFNSLMGGLAPRLVDWMMEALYFRKQKSGKPTNRADDALDRPTTGLRERGDYEGHVRESSVYTKAAMHPLVTGAAVLGAGLALASLAGLASKGDSKR